MKENRQRTIQKKIRLTKEENDYIYQKIKDSPFDNFQNFARVLLIMGEINIVDYSELEKLNREVNRIGTNINQLTKLAHKFEEISEEDIQELQEVMRELKEAVQTKLTDEIKKERII